MLANSKEQNLQDVIRGPVGVAGIAIILIAGCFAIADIYLPGLDDTPDDKPLFGDFLIGAIDEVIYYLRWGVYLAIIGGGLMIGISLRLTNTTHMMKTK